MAAKLMKCQSCKIYTVHHLTASGVWVCWCGESQCAHPRVEIHTRLYAMETRYTPAEYSQRAQCLECGGWMDVTDIPEDAEVRDA